VGSMVEAAAVGEQHPREIEHLQGRFDGIALEHFAQVLRGLLRVLWLFSFEREGPAGAGFRARQLDARRRISTDGNTCDRYVENAFLGATSTVQA